MTSASQFITLTLAPATPAERALQCRVWPSESIDLPVITDVAKLEATVMLQQGEDSQTVPVVSTFAIGSTFYTSIIPGQFAPMPASIDLGTGTLSIDAAYFHRVMGLGDEPEQAPSDWDWIIEYLESNFAVWQGQLLVVAEKMPHLEPRVWGADRNGSLCLVTQGSRSAQPPSAYPQFALCDFPAAQDALRSLCKAANGSLSNQTITSVVVPHDLAADAATRHRFLALPHPDAHHNQLLSLLDLHPQVEPFDAQRTTEWFLGQLEAQGWDLEAGGQCATFKLSDVHSLRVVFDQTALLGTVYSVAAILILSYPAIDFHRVITRVPLDDAQLSQGLLADLYFSVPENQGGFACNADFVLLDSGTIC